jgi:putative ABC transport system permease protein
MALRTALGASRARLIRQLLTESGFLALAGGGLGMLLAFGAVKMLLAIGPENLPRLDAVGVDHNVALYTVGVTILTGLLFSVVPAMRSSNQELTRTLNEGSSRSGGSVRHQRTRSGLVVTEMALSLVLLVGAGLTVRSFVELIDVGVGFETEDVISAQIHLPGSSYSETHQRTRFFDDLVERVRGLPGATAASAVTWLPLAGTGTGTSFWVNDRPIPEPGEIPVADIRWVDQAYHRTLGIPLLEGRLFDERDRADGPLNVLASEKLAREFWPNTSAIGKTISMPWGDTLVATVVGVVGDVRHNGPSIDPRMTLYWEHRQFQPFNFMSLVVRADGNHTSLMATIRAEVQRIDPDLPVFRVRSMDSYLEETMAQSRFAMLTLGLFAAIAVVLAAVGIYGVMSYAVSQQTHEIGIRMALGAGNGDVVGLVIRNGMMLTGIAVGIGTGGALALARLMEGMVFGISTSDPLTFIGVSSFLAAVALLACFLPAKRATKVDPIKVLKAE